MTSSNDAAALLLANTTSQGAGGEGEGALQPPPPQPSTTPPPGTNIANNEPISQAEAKPDALEPHIKSEKEAEPDNVQPTATNQTTTSLTTTTITTDDTTPNGENAPIANLLDEQIQNPEPELPPQSKTPIEVNATATADGQSLESATGAPHLPDHYMPSPPTVSPLSTPAVTAIHSTNGDNALMDDDLPRLTDEHISAASLSAMNRDLQDLSSLQAFAAQQIQSQGYAAVATTDDDINYPQHALNTGRLSRSNTVTDIDPAAFMMGANASMPSDYPTAIAPSEISLAISQGGQDEGTGTGTFESASASASQKLESFARIEFADSVFQMTTYAVIIGRDQRAMEQARKDERRANKYREACERAELQGLPPPTPMGRDRGKFSKSYVSEEGGILGPESDGGDSNAPRKKAPSQHDDAEVNDDQDDNAKTNLQYVSHSEGAAAVDLSSMQPSSSHVPFVGIHSPGPNIAARTKGISRQHLKIQFSERKGIFEGIAMHKNGFFCDDVHYGFDEPVTMRSGSRIQIKDVEFYFVINGVENGKTGAEDLHEVDEASSKRCSVGGKEMSLEFEHSDQEQKKKFLRNTDSPSPVQVAQTPPPLSEEPEEEMAEEEEDPEEAALLDDQIDFLGGDDSLPFMDMDAATAAALLQSVEGGVELPPDFVMPRRRGPGRPPKDGIMSKRERRLLKKQLEAQQISKKTLPQEPAGEKIKRPVGRPRKNPLPEDGDRPEKRKYTKRKREDGEEGSDPERRAKDKKDKKIRPKSPPLDLKIEDYTHEQLKKPAKNYVHLIDEALQAGPEEGLSLKQIYKRITAAYPWYYFSAETKGWESSVRHNLIGNDGFKKNEETGLWQRVHGIDLDAGKKRKAPTPERQLGSLHQMGQQAYYHHPSYMQQGPLQFADGLPGNMATNAQHQQTYGQPASQTTQHYAPSQPQTNGQINHVQQLQGASSHLAATPGSSVMPRQAGPQGAYNNPYARPSTTPNTQFNTAPIAPNSHGQQTGLPQAVAQNARPQQSAAPVVPVTTKSGLGNPADNPKIVTFKESMLKMLSTLSVSPAKIQQLVETAINKAFGLPALPTIGGFEKVESRLTNEVLRILGEDSHPPPAAPAPAPAPATTAAAPAPVPVAVQTPVAAAPPPPKQQTPGPRPSPAASSLADAEVESSLAVFRDNFMKTFRSKCPQADFIMESAVNQAKGLPNAGKVKGWEQVNDLLVTEVTKIINNVRKKFSSQIDSVASPRQSLQASPSPAIRHATSASPTPGQPAVSAGAAPNPVQSSSTPYTPSAAKPTTPARPSIMRPGAVSVARPSINRPPSGVGQPASGPQMTSPSKAPVQASTPAQAPAQAPATASAPTPVSAANPAAAAASAPSTTSAPAPVQPVAASSNPAAASVSATGPSPSPAPAQPAIATPKGPTPSPIVQSVPPHRPPSTTAPAAPNSGLGTGSLHDTPIPKTISPLPQAVTHPPLAKTASPAPPPTTVPSAGVLNQIMGQGQKRSLESVHGPGNDSAHQPEPKKVSTSAP
ncbi:hypothetical protein G7054_g6037 [Neopestalotiopsis clavispora]|nr:hypothetical protein G7054_g6037 [Neopestalotiopsis clavispora]